MSQLLAAFTGLASDPSAAARRLWDLLVEEIVTHPVHVAIELLFAVVIVYFLVHPIRKAPSSKRDERPTPEEEEELLAAFSSKPFAVPECRPGEEGPAIELQALSGLTATVGGKQVVNGATFDFLGMSTHEQVRLVAERTICEYGVGSCGPRGFYGSLKPHIDLESDLASFLGTHSAIIYSFSFATSSTLIPCFSARGDEILVDEACCLPVQQGCLLSRSLVKTYRHNDMAHLEALMAESQQRCRRKGTLPRRFVITEGLFRNTGDVASLDQVCRLKQQYKFRLILDDCFGFGVLGKTGRGTPEHFSIPQTEIDIYVGCMSGALGSVGGFCAGSYTVIDHQRLAATGYVFSASLPPYCSASASKAIEIIKAKPDVVQQLQRNAKLFRETVPRCKLTALVRFVDDTTTKHADAHSPLALFLTENVAGLRKAADELLSQGWLVAVATYNQEYKWPVTPGLRVAVKAAMTTRQVEDLARAVVDALNRAVA